MKKVLAIIATTVALVGGAVVLPGASTAATFSCSPNKVVGAPSLDSGVHETIDSSCTGGDFLQMMYLQYESGGTWHQASSGSPVESVVICFDRDGNVGCGASFTRYYAAGSEHQNSGVFTSLLQEDGASLAPYCQWNLRGEIINRSSNGGLSNTQYGPELAKTC